MYNCTIQRSILLLVMLFLCTPALYAIDTNDSQVIGMSELDFADFALVAKHWMKSCTDPDWCKGADFDKNKIVNMADLVIFFDRWMDRNNLVGRWKFDRFSGTHAIDSSENNNTANLTNGPRWTNQASLTFDGTDDYVDCGSGPSLNLTGDLTISAWIYPENFGDGGLARIVDRHGNQSGFAFYVKESTQGISFLTYAGSYTDSDNDAVNLNQWQHVAVTYSDSSDTVTFYVNGEPVGIDENYQTNPNDSADASFLIGNNDSLDNGFKGMISDVRVFSRTLSADEMTAIYITNEVRENKSLAFDLNATDSEGNPITYNLQNPQDLPLGATYNSNIFDWRPWYNQAGYYNIKFQPEYTAPIIIENVTLSSWYQHWLEATNKY